VRHGMPYPRKVRDTIAASRVLRNGTQYPHNLAQLIQDYCGVTLPKELQKADWGDPGLSGSPEEHIKYAAGDVAFLRKLHSRLVERLEVFRLVPVYELECGIIPAVAAMTLNGVGIDRKLWLERAEKAEAELKTLTPDLLSHFPLPDEQPTKKVRYRKLDGKPFEADLRKNKRIENENTSRAWNLASPAQVLNMFAKVGVKLPNTTYEAMCFFRDDHPLVAKFMHWRDLEK